MAQTAYSRRAPKPQFDRHFENAPTWERARYDVTDTYQYDISENLDSGETASSLEIADRYGVTVSTSSVTSAGVISVTITDGGDGYLRAKVTTSDSRVLAFPMQWRRLYTSRTDAYRAGR